MLLCGDAGSFVDPLSGEGIWQALRTGQLAAEPMALEPTLNLMSDADGNKRQAGAEALAKVFKDNVRLFTLITNTLAKDKEISDRWRGFKDVADNRHLANRVEAPVVDALVTSVRAAYPKLSHRYYALKAKWVGMDKLAHWDRNAPLPEKPDRTISWAQAQEMVLSAYAGFATEMASIAKPFFDRNWIDAPVRPGKAPGAFSASPLEYTEKVAKFLLSDFTDMISYQHLQVQ